MADDLQALIARLKELPAGATVTVIIPRGNPVTIGGNAYQEHDSYAVYAARFAPAPPPKGDDTAPQPEQFLVAQRELNMRAAPDATSDLLRVIPAGVQVVAYDGVTNKYRRVSVDGAAGWVLASGLTGA